MQYLNIKVTCQDCGTELDSIITVKQDENIIIIDVAKCNCVDASFEIIDEE